ncbi:MAG: hypothetical protein DLM59_05430 [Pseudonocardiales bacterium]|nr:MAG: hypothetical protein DLM59_05430 [Pseudonocardiales bacterium]
MTQSATTVDVPSLLHLAETARGCGDYKLGVAHSQQAADLAALQGADALQANALRLLAMQLIKLGEYERAARSADLAISLLEPLGDEAGVCKMLTFRAQAYSALGLHEEALTSLGTGLELAQRLGDNLLLFWTLNRIGTSHCDMTDWAQADPFLRHAHELAIGQDLGGEATFCILNNLAWHAQGYVMHLRALGEVSRAEKKLLAGVDHGRQAVDAARAAGHPFREAISSGSLGMLLGLAGDYQGAAEQIDRALELSAAHGYRTVELYALKSTADVSILRGDLPAAIARFTQVLDLATQINEPYVVLAVHQQLSAAHERIGDYRTALRHYRDYHRIERTVNTAAAERRAKLLTHRFELHNAQLAADKARLEARLAMLRSHELEAEKQALQMRATELGRDANTDPLTGLWNRRHMDDQFPHLFRRAQETGRPLCVAIGDLDRFKNVNDRFGHAAGDQVLRQLAAILRGGCRPGDLVARMGGEEFFLAFIDTEFPAARATCERLRKAVEDYEWGAIRPDLAVTVSFGLAAATGIDHHDQLLDDADISLYVAKRAGRNRVAPPMTRT